MLVVDMEENQTVHITLDARGLYCLMPIIKTNTIVKQMNAGEILKVLSTDSGSKRSIESWCKKTENELLEMSENEGVFSARAVLYSKNLALYTRRTQ